MAHHVYHTRGVILSSIPVGESNRFYKIFTEELGLISGLAQAVREGKSKLRYVLQDFSFVTVDLVRGKEVWRVISAGSYHVHEGERTSLNIKLFARFCALLSRLLHGEGRDQWLFDEVMRVADFLGKRILKKELMLSFETLATFRVLVHLGYMDPGEHERFMETEVYSEDFLETFEEIRPTLLQKINSSLNASHL